MAKILDGNTVYLRIFNEIKSSLEERKVLMCGQKVSSAVNPPPCLAVVLCSDDPASKIYVDRKRKACSEVGINSCLIKPFEGNSVKDTDFQKHLLEVIDWLNKDVSIHGILVQLPLPQMLDRQGILNSINPLKDVDCLTPENIGLLLQGRPRFTPCTPAGIQELLISNNISIEGKKVCIINRSDIVGKPLAAFLCQNNDKANATVTLCHDFTPPDVLKEICLSSDIIVVAVGKHKFLTSDMVHEKSVVIDVGINRTDQNKISGDVDFEPVFEKVAAISPVPGGCGPCTISFLLKNVILAQQLQNNSFNN